MQRLGIEHPIIQVRTERPFGINLFAPLPQPGTPSEIERALGAVAEAFSRRHCNPMAAR